jgi:antirestriction protein ArdC
MAVKQRRQLTDEERAERRERDREYARQAVDRLRSSEGWRAWLTTRATFHGYSLGNQLLVAMQRPTATKVAGFGAWLKLGYCVSRGETAIRIWAPCPPTCKQLEKWRQSGADPDQRPRTFFKLTAVFADDQVAPLPPPAVPAPLDPPIRDVEGDELAPVIPSLVALAEEIGCTVAFAPISGAAHGYYQPSTDRIVVDDGLSANQRVKTLSHELAHALVRHDRQPDDPALDYAGEELVAESVAYTCVGALGVSTEDYSIPYLASWAESSDLEVLARTAGLIDRLARRIEDATIHDLPGSVDTDAATADQQPVTA